MEQHSEKGWDRVFDLNVKGLFFVSQLSFPLLKAATSKDFPSRIINIGSIAGLKPQSIPTYAYDCSKSAVHQLTIKLAASLANENILCNAMAPGLFPSHMGDQVLTYSDKETIEASIPLGRMGSTDDMMGITVYLCSKASNWLTGAIIPLDGGALLPRSLL